MIFGKYAELYYDLGLAPLPLGKPGGTGRDAQAAFTKGWQKAARDRYEREVLQDYVEKYADRNLGIGLGTILFDDLQLVAIDVDNDEYVEYVRRSLPATPCGKIGSKGVTWFALAPSDMKTRRFVKKSGTLVEVLAVGSQTVIPPSIHPKTEKPYVWEDSPLYEVEIRALPVITNSFLLELQSITSGNGAYFIGGTLESGEEISGINDMVWSGVGGGGDTYDSRLRCIAHMVATGWEDDEIINRVRRAQREAVERAGEQFEWPDCERETQQQIDDARKKNFDQPAKKSKVPAERVWAEWLTTQVDHPVYYADIMFSYADGFYHQETRGALTSRIIKTFSNSTAPKAITAYNTFCDLVYRDEFGSQGSNKICLLNGTLNITNQSLHPWSPEDELLYRMDVEWDSEAECPQYDEFVNWVFAGDEDAIRAWDEFCGLSFVDDVSFQKALFLLGGGGNGKSTLVGILNGIHNDEMISTVPITELDSERKVTSMVGKFLNISTEQSRINSITDNVFKQIVGGDPISVRKLYAEAENNIVLKVRFLCLANELPSLQDSSHAIKRRLIILNCPNTVEEGDQNPKMVENILCEKSGILRRWVQSLSNLKERGKFVIPDQSEQTVNSYLQQSDPVALWASMRAVSSKVAVDINHAYYDFRQWAKESGYHAPCALPFWRRRMENLGYKVEEVTIGGRSVVQIYVQTVTGIQSEAASRF